MARIKYSALVDNIRGSIGGTTFQNNRYGYSVKNKSQLVNKNTGFQIAQRNRVSFIARQWRQLSEDDRQDWNIYAENNPRPTKYNPDAYLSGYNYYMFYNRYRDLAQQLPLASPSLILQSQGELEYIMYNDAGALQWETNPADNTGSWSALLFLTNVIPFGREYVNFTPRFITSVQFDTGALTVVTSQFQEKLGSIPPVGQWIGIRVVAFCETTGQVIVGPTTQIELIAPP